MRESRAKPADRQRVGYVFVDGSCVKVHFVGVVVVEDFQSLSHFFLDILKTVDGTRLTLARQCAELVV